jgi:hydrogenase-4 component B
VTGGAALIAALAIAGFPPFVGFTGKWLMLQATTLSGIPVVSLAGLALLVASLMSVLYATKFFAATFANRPMREGDLEVPGPMCAAQLVLVALVALMSLAPVPLLHALVWALRDAPALAGVTAGWAVAGAVGPATGAFAPLPLLLAGAWALVIAGLALGREAPPAARRVWTGGVRADRGDPRVHPDGFYSPIREGLRRAYPRPHLPRLASPRWILPAVDLDRWFYRPAGSAGRRVTEGLRRVHTGVPHLYLVWQLAGAGALVLLLLALLRR